MLDALSEKFERILKKLRGQGVLTEENIAEALKEVRLALLEADVNFKVVKDFLDRVREKAIGQEVLKSLTPGHQVVKVVWDELRGMMGGERSGISLASRPPTILMMVGLQGAGKTTTAGKLASSTLCDQHSHQERRDYMRQKWHQQEAEWTSRNGPQENTSKFRGIFQEAAPTSSHTYRRWRGMNGWKD